MKNALFVIVGLLVMGGPVLAVQHCDDAKPESTPMSRFQANGDGTISDDKTGLVWRRCAVGMQWTGRSCEGQSSIFNFINARLTVDELNDNRDSQRSNWRLPTAKELGSLVESRCFKPAINLEAFPFSPESGFWTATEVSGHIMPRMAIVHFLNGGEYIAAKTQSWRLRPVADK